MKYFSVAIKELKYTLYLDGTCVCNACAAAALGHAILFLFYIYNLISSSLTAEGVKTPKSVSNKVMYWGGV